MPCPPNQPNSFWVPCPKNSAPTIMRSNVSPSFMVTSYGRMRAAGRHAQ